MSSDIDAFLAGVRDADDPSSADEQRVMRALRVSIAAGVASSVAVKASALPSAAGKSVLGSGLSGLAAKLGVVAVSGAVAVGAGHALISSKSSAPVAVETTPGPGQTGPAPRMPPANESVTLKPESSTHGAAADPEPAQRAGGAAQSKHAKAKAKPEAASEHAKATAKPEAASERASAASLEAELALLREVQAALRRGAGNEALRKLDTHRTRDRQLLAERSAARILALCAVGRVEEARRAAQVFLKQHPRSLQRAAIVESCASPGLGPKP
jgi:hypothetical protein